MVEFKGSTQEKQRLEIFRFGYGKASNDKKVLDPAGSAVTRVECSATTRANSLKSVAACTNSGAGAAVARSSAILA